MQKSLLIALVLIILVVLCVGCTKAAEQKIGQDIEDITEDAENSEELLDDTKDAPTTEDVINLEDEETHDMSDESTPCDSFEKFMEVKNHGLEILTGSMDESADFYISARFELLAVALVDFRTLDLSFVTHNIAAAETAASIMGLKDMKLDYSGEDFNLSYIGEDGKAYVRTGNYDSATDSLTCTFIEDNTETLLLEYAKYDGGYAAQYYITDETGTTIIKLFIDGEDVVLGIAEDCPSPPSIYKAASIDTSFADDCSSVYKFVDGIGTYKCDDGDNEL